MESELYLAAYKYFPLPENSSPYILPAFACCCTLFKTPVLALKSIMNTVLIGV